MSCNEVTTNHILKFNREGEPKKARSFLLEKFLKWRGDLGQKMMRVGSKWASLPYENVLFNDGSNLIVAYSSMEMDGPPIIKRVEMGAPGSAWADEKKERLM